MTRPPIDPFGEDEDRDPRQMRPGPAQARILVVEDLEAARDALAELLRSAGYLVDTACDGSDALIQAGEQPPDLIITDVAMPRTDGFSLVAELRQRARLADTPIILISGEGDATRRVMGLDLGADDYLPKPIHSGELLARIRLHLRRAHRMREIVARSTTDELTGVLNRGGILGVLERERQRARRHPSPLALLVIDVDDFKAINDNFGHAIGDRVLARIAQHLTAVVRAADRVGRFGGDEFLVVAPNTGSLDAQALMNRITTMRDNPVVIAGDVQLTVKLSVGCAIDDGNLSTEELFTRADSAMYRQKRLSMQTMH